jgi:uncharacterized membrane protein/YHS domain-containing protein
MSRTTCLVGAAWTAVLVVAAARAGGQDDLGAPSPEATGQVYCPVIPEEKIDPEFFADHEGRRIYFCCGRCRGKFKRDPEPYLALLVGSAPAADQAADGHEHDPTEHGNDGTVAGAASDGHDHDGHDRGPSAGWLEWLGGFHPAMVNFPIGLVGAGAVAEALFFFRRREEFDHASRFCVAFGAVTGVAAGALGWLFAGVRLTDADTLLGVHRWLGTGTVVWLLALLWTSERARRASHPGRGWFRFFLFGGAALVLATGFFGGAMVYGLDHYLLP